MVKIFKNIHLLIQHFFWKHSKDIIEDVLRFSQRNAHSRNVYTSIKVENGNV